ncbi:hypothetical protein BGX21_008309 [Mortierella sp. AD011]|nr:hypothetical protein BGX20_009801 [Mortierella sp. AD010]KAF9397967.1 hypothetical protein BGX21_008309 [Mortierella sp. AD011]
MHLNDIHNVLDQPETEHNWAAKESAIKSLTAACNSSTPQNQEFIAFIKNHRKAFNESLLTERTRLSGTACELVEKLSKVMGRDFGLYFSDLFTPALLKVCARTNKVMVTRAVKALSSIINAGCVVTLPKLCQAFASNNKTLRIACIGLIASCIALFTTQELEPSLAAFEPVLKEGVSDAAPEVRDTSRKSFKVYAEKFPERSQMMTATLPASVLKYLIPNSKSSISLSRTGTSAARRPDTGDLARQQSTVGLTRTGPSRVGPVRARTIATAEQTSTSFKTPASSSQSTQPYSYHGAQQSHTQQPSLSHQTLTRNHGPASRIGPLGDLSDNGSHGVLRVSSQRSRTFSSSSSSATSSMPQRSPSINLATNGGPQRVVPSESTKPTRPTSMINRLSKVEPISKPIRASTSSSNHASTDREPMSANERAKAYAASLKNEMANRRSVDLHMRGVGARRVASDHVAYSGLQSTSTSASASTASTSTATSTTTVSPASSSSTSPTALHSPNHDQMFTTLRAPANPHMASSPPESCPSPDNRHSTPPMSQHADDAALSASLSPTFMAQVSLEGKEQYNAQHPHPNEASVEPLEQAPLSPHSPHHQTSFNLTNNAGNTEHVEFVKAGEGDLDIIDAYANEDPDHNMSIPDHESLFGNTENYLQAEKEISELQQSFKGQVATEEEEKCLFMDEDPQLEQEQLAVKAYAEYEATMAAASCSSSSLPSSHDEE